MKNKLFTAICLSILFTGCSNNQALNEKATEAKNSSKALSIVSSENSSSVIMEEETMMKFNELLTTKNISEERIIEFLDNNIENVSSSNASIMVLGMEEVQNKNYEKRLNSFFTGNIQKKMYKTFSKVNNLSVVNSTEDLNTVQDEELKKYLSDILQWGYKVITSEGQYYPIQNYEFLNKYKNYITEDIREYINIQALESSTPSLSDAALTISWDEVFSRALKCENFLKKYPSSPKTKEVKSKYLFYSATYLYGTNNSPTFDYVSNELSKELLVSYKKLSSNKSLEGSLVKITRDYLDVLKKHNYKLTDEVETHRKTLLSNLEKNFN